MTATQDLIAAALRLTAIAERNTDDRDEWQHSISEVREMCARAMVQPDMSEVKNLVSAACNLMFDAGKLLGRRDAGADREVEDARSARTALLDYVRGVIAERDQFRDAAKMVSAAEVPMPEPDGELEPDGEGFVTLSNTLFDYGGQIYTTETLRTYGDDREAAGYARGLKEAMKDVERYRFLRKDFSPMGLDIDCNHAWAYRRNATLKGPNLDAAIDAALRGEVKP